MAGTRFDIQFAGELLEGTDPREARARLQQLFNLSEQAAERLFGGKPVTIKRQVDTATASRFREVFRDAGALVRVIPVEAMDATPSPPVPSDAAPSAAAERVDDPSTEGARLRLAPVDSPQPLEPQPQIPTPNIDISYLSLVAGEDWTLEDCEPPLPLIELPNISHLAILMPQETEEDGA